MLEVLQPFMNETRAGLEAVRRDVEELKTQTTSEVMGNAALRKLLPYMNRMEGNLQNRVNSLARDLEEVNEKVCDLTENEFPIVKSNLTTLKETMTTEIRAVKRQLENYTMSEVETLHATLWSNNTDQLTQICAKMEAMDSRLVSLSSALNLTAVKNQVKEHNSQVTSKLIVLQTKQDAIDSKLDILDSKQDELNIKVMSVNSELEQNILSLTNVTKQLQTTSESSLGPCGGEGWRRVAYLDMTDPNTNCPSGWQLGTRDSKRTCDRFSTGRLTCDSVFFPVSGGAYTGVCGRIRAYQYGPTDAFGSYHDGQATTIDEAYVSGVSLTHGSPRQHIWTFAAGITYRNQEDACPCDDTVTISIPPFVGEDYFCESGNHSGSGTWGGFHPYDPLWDGQNCTSTSRCCSFNNPPYFTKQLTSPTTDDLEVRLCLYDSGEDAPIEFIELYVGLGEMNTKALHQNVLINTQKLTHMISSKMDVIDSRLVIISSAIVNDTDLQEAEKNILTNVTKETQKMSNSLHEVMEELEQNISNTVRNELYDHVHEDLGEFERDVLSNVTTQLNDLAENNDLHNHVCGSTGGWTRAIYLDMTDPNTTCPSGWLLNTMNSKRTCDHINDDRYYYYYHSNCTSVFFPVSGGAYNRVCGRVTAYQYSYARAFHSGRATTIDEPYVSGVSLTHGSPRQHIWTFAAGVSELLYPTEHSNCPCDASVKISVPLFVGGDYFCESGVNSGRPSGFQSDDPLWDGKNCISSSRCCSFNNPPYFTKRLSSATTDDIEVRLCSARDSDRSNSPIELLEIYTKLDVVDVEEVEHNVVSGVREELKTTYDSLLEDHGRMNVHVCGGTGGWRRVVYLDMTDPNTNCPSGWQCTEHSNKRACGKVDYFPTCDSVFFPVSGGAYTSVCGRIKGYQLGYPDAFYTYHSGTATTIDEPYVSGISLTHSSPRQHIWTFAASRSSTHTNDRACPCNSTSHNTAPPFVGGDYFCESGINSGSPEGFAFHPDDPLWDGDSCAVSSTCCPFNNPPYFTKRLSSATTDDLEVRICRYYINEDTPIEFMELYIK